MVIYFNQVGYMLNRPKTAFATEGESFSLVDAMTGESVLEKETESLDYDKLSGLTLKKLDFSEFNTEGFYHIKVDGVKTVRFAITNAPYNIAKKALMKQFYFQRCGMELLESYAGPYVHTACHESKATLISDLGIPLEKTVDVSGGWHNGGDYGRYTVSAATALGHLLYAYELFPEKLEDKLVIPPGMFKVPDLLIECRHEFEWLLKMQTRDLAQRGGFHHKVTTKNYCGMIMPEYDGDELFLFPVSSTATAFACGALLVGMRVFKKIDSKFARQLRDSAEMAWRWLSNNRFESFSNPPEFTTDEYSANDDTDGRYWAAIEMYRLTKQAKYLDYARTLLSSIAPVSFNWKRTGGFGSLSYLMSIDFNVNDRLGSKLSNSFIEEADRLVEISKTNAFGVTLTPVEFKRGSNSAVICNAMVLITAFQVSTDQRRSIDYENVALEQLHYILGRNASGYCFISGLSPKSINFPHHRPSTADGIKQCIPGILAGGPNAYFEDPCVKEHLNQGTPPARCFMDDYRSFSTNENSISWNSCAIFLAAYFD